MNINDLGYWVPVGSAFPTVYTGKNTVFSLINTEESPGLLHRFYLSGDMSDIRSFLYFRVIWVNADGMRTETGRWLKEWPEQGINKVLKLDNSFLLERGVGLYFEVAKKIYGIRTEPSLKIEDSDYRVNLEAFIPDIQALQATQLPVNLSASAIDAIAAQVVNRLSLPPE